MIIGGIKVGCYGKITRSSLASSFYFRESPTEVTLQVEKILGNNDTLAATFALSEEEAEKL